MKKIVLFSICCFLISTLVAQDSTANKKKTPINLSGRANDHLLVQLGYTGWTGKPDSINTGGFSKSFNVYFMFDFPFKTSPKLSIGVGAGVSSDHIIFDKTYVDIAGTKGISPTLKFIDQSDTSHFKKTKLNTTYLEAPVEFRYTANPLDSDRSFKFAIGAKVGTLINTHTRNVELQSASGNTINSYTMKESSKQYFNTTRLVGTARIGYGHFTIYGTYQITALFQEGVAAEIRPYSIGLTLSGL